MDEPRRDDEPAPVEPKVPKEADAKAPLAEPSAGATSAEPAPPPADTADEAAEPAASRASGEVEAEEPGAAAGAEEPVTPAPSHTDPTSQVGRPSAENADAAHSAGSVGPGEASREQALTEPVEASPGLAEPVGPDAADPEREPRQTGMTVPTAAEATRAEAGGAADAPDASALEVEAPWAPPPEVEAVAAQAWTAGGVREPPGDAGPEVAAPEKPSPVVDEASGEAPEPPSDTLPAGIEAAQAPPPQMVAAAPQIEPVGELLEAPPEAASAEDAVPAETAAPETPSPVVESASGRAEVSGEARERPSDALPAEVEAPQGLSSEMEAPAVQGEPAEEVPEPSPEAVSAELATPETAEATIGPHEVRAEAPEPPSDALPAEVEAAAPQVEPVAEVLEPPPDSVPAGPESSETPSPVAEAAIDRVEASAEAPQPPSDTSSPAAVDAPPAPPLAAAAASTASAALIEAAYRLEDRRQRPAPWRPTSLPSREALERLLPYLRLAGRAVAAVALGYVAIVATLVVLYRWVDPPVSTLMLGQRLGGTPIERRWVPLDRISRHLVKAVLLSEDGAFCRHRGVDWTALVEAIEDDRGGSTITMQVVKNLFLWPSRSYVRKALEFPLAYLVELIWPKRRILEIYLNIAEWGDGVFGAEAAAREHFLKSASRLTAGEAALLAVALPNPLEREAGSPSAGTRRLAARLLSRMRLSRADLACVRAPRRSRAGTTAPLVPDPRLTL